MTNPPYWFTYALSKFAGEVYKETGYRGVLSVTLDCRLAINFGLKPGEKMKVHGAAGYVEVVSEYPKTVTNTTPVRCVACGRADDDAGHCGWCK
jgi:hypothetical protein